MYEEGSSSLNTPIKLQYRRNQNPFTVTLTPTSIDQAEVMGLGPLLNSMTITSDSRATAGMPSQVLLTSHSVLFHYVFIITILSIILNLGSDFSSSSITITVPANTQNFEVPHFFSVTDDDIDEEEQSFALVAEIGPDVPDGVSCFQISEDDRECNGRRGATEVRISDNDSKPFN